MFCIVYDGGEEISGSYKNVHCTKAQLKYAHR